MHKSCIYLLYNKTTGNRYIGATNNLNRRKMHHLSELRNNKHGNRLLQTDFDEYGEDSFEFVALRYCSKRELFRVEQQFLEWCNPEYNIVDHENPFSDLFYKNTRSEETNKKRSESLKKFHKTEKGQEYLKKRSKEWKGKNNPIHSLSSDQRSENAKIANRTRTDSGYKHSKLTKAKMSKSAEKEWVGAIDPDGKVYAPIIGLKRFSEEHNLNYKCMYDLMIGNQKTHKGWTKYNDIIRT